MQGRISCTSVDKYGEMTPLHSTKQGIHKEQSMADENIVVLVVDDNEMNRDMLSRRLRRQEYEVEVAEDGEQALKMVKEKNYDLMLLDIMMPNISGYEVLERIKADPQTQRLPIIMISAVDDLDSVVRCIELGAEDYLFKPFNPVLLKARVGASLSKNRSGIDGTKLKPFVESIETAVSTLKSSGIDASLQGHLDTIQSNLDSIKGQLGK
jgi:DNA-binding response OmpR family regulator